MAYADKITTMRRMALFHQPDEDHSGNIEWEGVDIEGMCLLLKASWLGTTTMALDANDLDNYCLQHDLVARYQDPEGEDSWEPRAA